MSALSKYRHLSWILLLIPIYAFMFVKLGAFHIRIWDEGWFAVHAYEMLERGSLIVPYYDGVAAHFGSKPPLQTWLQMIFIKAIGYNELALRLPSALAAAGTVLLVFFWVRKMSTELMAWVAALTLLTIDGFIHHHTARGAEADSLLTLTLIFQAYFFWRWLQRKQYSDLIGLAIFIALSFWVKAVAGFLLLPAFLVYMLVYERRWLREALTDKWVYAILLGGVAAGISYLAIREWAQPGYLAFVMEKQAGRLVNDVGHDQPFLYYFHRFADERLTRWLPIVMVSLIWTLADRSERVRPFRYASVLAVVYFLVISFSRSKLEWYALPLYPLFSIAVGYTIGRALEWVGNKWTYKLSYGLMAVIFLFPVHTMYAKAQENKIDEWSRLYEMEEQYLFDAYHDGRSVDGLIVLYDHFEGGLLFYKYKFSEIGQDISIQDHTELEVGSRILVNSEALKEELASKYVMDTLDQLETALVLRIERPLDSMASTVEPEIARP